MSSKQAYHHSLFMFFSIVCASRCFSISCFFPISWIDLFGHTFTDSSWEIQFFYCYYFVLLFFIWMDKYQSTVSFYGGSWKQSDKFQVRSNFRRNWKKKRKRKVLKKIFLWFRTGFRSVWIGSAIRETKWWEIDFVWEKLMHSHWHVLMIHLQFN